MEFPIFSFFVSLFSIITGNGTTNTNSSTINNNTQHSSSVRQHIILATLRPTTTTMPPEPQQPIDLLSILCPEHANSTLLYKTRYHNQTKKCYTVPSQGPCGNDNNMEYFADDDIFGSCGCKIDNRLLIYNKNQNKCFYIFQRAYCKKFHWLDITRDGQPICTLNPCVFHSSQKDLVRLRGKCVEVGKSSSQCPADEVVGFEMFRRVPTCISPRSLLISPRAIGIPSTPCSIGSVMAISGRCNPPFDFD